jgi:hypothetical protein
MSPGGINTIKQLKTTLCFQLEETAEKKAKNIKKLSFLI